jgi:hypothetical protein
VFVGEGVQVASLFVDVNYRQDMPNHIQQTAVTICLPVTPKYFVKITHVLFFNVNVQPWYSVFFITYQLYCFTCAAPWISNHGSTHALRRYVRLWQRSRSTKHTDSFQDMNAFALIIEDTQAKPARGGNKSLTPCQERPLNELPLIGNEDHREKGVSQL